MVFSIISINKSKYINKFHKIKMLIACLLETHLVSSDKFILSSRWTNSFVASHLTNSLAKTIILYREND